MTLPSPDRRPRLDAADRILQSAVRRSVISGCTALTMHEVSEEAGVSKGLIHYHFHDKETLLARMVEWITVQLVARERETLALSSPRRAIDGVWEWLDGELQRGHLRVLLELTEWREGLVQRAIRSSMIARREAAMTSVHQLFTLLGLRPRVPVPLLADVVVAFVNGLANAHAVEPALNTRAAFDVFWLALLGLAE